MICKKCGIEKEEEQFRIVGKYRLSQCRECELKYQREYYHRPENMKKHKEYRRKYYEEHREEELRYATWYNRTQRGRSNKIVNNREERKEINKRVKELEEQEKQQQRIIEYFKNKRR